jgi:hypothetical protein
MTKPEADLNDKSLAGQNRKFPGSTTICRHALSPVIPKSSVSTMRHRNSLGIGGPSVRPGCSRSSEIRPSDVFLKKIKTEF